MKVISNIFRTKRQLLFQRYHKPVFEAVASNSSNQKIT